MDFGKCIMTCIYHYSIIQNSFMTLKSLLCSAYSSFLSLSPLAATDLFTVYSFAFSRRSCSWNHTACSLFKFFFPPSNIHLSFFHAFSWVFKCWIIFRCLDIPQLIYPFTYQRTSRLLPSFGNYEQSCYKHLSAGFCVDICFQLLRVNTKECDCWINMVKVCLVL